MVSFCFLRISESFFCVIILVSTSIQDFLEVAVFGIYAEYVSVEVGESYGSVALHTFIECLEFAVEAEVADLVLEL
jgi:hypothetical protein